MSTASTSPVSSQNKSSPSSWAKLPPETRQNILYLATSVNYAGSSGSTVKKIEKLPGKIATLMQVNKLMRSDMAFVIKQHKKEVWNQYDKLEIIIVKYLKDEAASSLHDMETNLTHLRNAVGVAFVIYRLTKQVS